MSNKIYLKIFPFFVAIFLLSKNVYAQGAASDQYKQMGGVTGLTEICFKTKNLELTLLKQIGQLFYTQPEMGEMVFSLLYDFYDAKTVVMKKKLYGMEQHNLKTKNNLIVKMQQIKNL